MEKEVKRYRVSPKHYLCLSPEEAVSTGITVGEETVEELSLTKGLVLGSLFYASIRGIDEYELMKIPVQERKEVLFNSRKEAARYIAENNSDGTLYLYSVKDIKSVPRENIGNLEDTVPLGILEELKKFGQTG